MKWIAEVWGLFVDDPILALLGVVSLAVGFFLSHMGYSDVAGLAMFVVIVAAMAISVRRN
ncbi:MAG: hypothetical protein ACYCT0_11090 [Sulfobacillus sp.]